MPEEITLIDRTGELMKDGEPRTSALVAGILGVDRSYARKALAYLVDAKHLHVCGYAGSHHAKVFQYGPGEDARKILHDTPQARAGRKQAAKKRAERHVALTSFVPIPKSGLPANAEFERLHWPPVRWWPAVDTALTNAFRAMIEVGARVDAD